MAGVELVFFCLRRKERSQALHFRALSIAEGIESFNELGQGRELAAHTREGCSASYKEVGVLGSNRMLLVKLERNGKAFTQLREVLQRAAQECDMSANGTSACEARDGLRNN